jgi:hypothetical protein
MAHEEVGRFWNGNAEAWTKLARAGFDVYRDYLNTPAFFELLPDVAGRLEGTPAEARRRAQEESGSRRSRLPLRLIATRSSGLADDPIASQYMSS